MKKVVALIMALGTVGCALMSTACGPEVVDKVDKTKTALRIANYNGGVGEEWLEKMALRFEETYKDVPFEEGKMGVDIVLDHNKKYSGNEIGTTLPADTSNNIYFTQALYYNQFVNDGLLADITDLVTETTGSDNKKIQDKLSEAQKDFLQVDGKYYALPHYELYNGIQYDAGVFATKKLYFSDSFNADGTRKYILSANAKKSPGPDGIYNTYDDGLPSSYEEFYRLIDTMKDNNVIPFVWTGKSPHYTNMLLSSLHDNYVGAEFYDLLLNFEETEIELVTSHAGGTLQTKKEKLTKETAYKAKSSAGMYYALEFCQKIFKKDSGYFPVSCTAGGYTHLDAQERLWNSGLDGDKYVGMLIDGNYSYNEAENDGILDRMKEDYPLTYKQKDVRYMPMPVQYSGTVKEGEGKSPVLVDSSMSYAFINASTKGVALEVAKKFLSFAYSDSELAQFTLDTNGVVKGVSYDLESLAENENLCNNGRTMLQMRSAAMQAGSFVYPYVNTPIFRANANMFQFKSGGLFWQTKSAASVYNGFNDGMTVAKYFDEMQWTQSQWSEIIQ